MDILTPISQEEFNNLIEIKFDNINEGFDKYKYRNIEVVDQTLTTYKKELIFKDFFTEALKLNNGKCYVDFYLKNINKESIANLMDALDKDNKIILKSIIEKGPYYTIYFKTQNELALNFINTLNCKELFFCTIYFTEYPVTIWGNYNFTFPIFFENDDVVNEYKKIAIQCGLKI